MKPRDLIKLVRAMQPALPRGVALLDFAAASMRTMRSLPPGGAELPPDWLDAEGVRALLAEDDALGQIYQAGRAGELERAYRATARHGRKFRPGEIPAVTGLFTPRWIVEFLLHNTLGRLWWEMHPDTRLRFEWLIEPVLPRADRALPHRAGEIRVLDPACGTMNFGIIAVEMLAAMYREESDRAGEPGWPVVPSIADATIAECEAIRRNLYGVDIDANALQPAKTTLELKARRPLAEDELNLRQGDALFDRSLQAGAFHVIVMNPPYLSARNLSTERVRRLKRCYPAAWRDLYACFLDRATTLLSDGGRLGALSMQSFMFTGGFQQLRESLHERAAIESIAHFGPGVFGMGNPGTLQTAAFVLRREMERERRAAQEVAAIRLTCSMEKERDLREVLSGPLSLRERVRVRTGVERTFDSSSRLQVEPSPLFSPEGRGGGAPVFMRAQRELASSPRGAWLYWLSPALTDVFARFPRLGEVAPPRQGLATTDNSRFVRYWWEVEPTPGARIFATPGRWRPYAKAGRFRRWHESPRYRVNWEDDGREIKAAIVERYPYLRGKWSWVAKNSEFYGREGVTYSYLTSGSFSARRLDAGAIFDVAGSSLFPDDPLTMLAVLNSPLASELLGAINPTVNFQVGDLAELPVPREGTDEIREMVGRLIEIQREIDRTDETAAEFERPFAWESGLEALARLRAEVIELGSRVNAAVAGLYGVASDRARDGIDASLLFNVDQKDLARAWISFAVRQCFADCAEPIWVNADGSMDRVRKALSEEAGASAAAEIGRTIGGLRDWLANGFFAAHVRRFRNRPVIWAFERRGRRFLIPHDMASADVLGAALGEIGVTLPAGWERRVDDGIQASLAKLWRWVPDVKLQQKLREHVVG